MSTNDGMINMLAYRLRRPWILVLIGAGLGIAGFATLFPVEQSGAACGGEREAGMVITDLVPQPTQRYFQPKLDIKASRQLFTDMDAAYAKTYYMPCGKNCHAPQRALRQLGWQKMNEPQFARIQHMDWADPSGYTDIKSWQRFNHIPNHKVFTKIDTFLTGMNTYKEKQQSNRQVFFLPESYRMHNTKERASLERTMKAANRPWILRTGLNKDGLIEVLEAGAAKKAVLKVLSTSKTSDHPSVKNQNLVTQYVCNQLKWEGQLFSVRVFWFVASLDPLLVFYQDGFARIGYKQTDPLNLKVTEQAADFDSLETFLRDYHQRNMRKLRKTVPIDDAVIHVRNQFKETIATVVDAFHDVSFQPRPTKEHAEDGYEVFMADFIIDQDLDVYLMDVYSDSSPHPSEHNAFLLEDNYFLLQKNHELWYGMGLTLQEVWAKQARNQNVLPLSSTGKWDLIVASNTDTTKTGSTKALDWMFTYEGYSRNSKKKEKKCKLWKNKQPKKRLPRMQGDEEPDEFQSGNTFVRSRPVSDEEDGFEEVQ